MATDGIVGTTILDLTDEAALLAEDRAACDPARVRSRLAELNLQTVGGPAPDARRGEVVDLAVYRATGDLRLASLFGAALFDPVV
jgi:hypothetical protein